MKKRFIYSILFGIPGFIVSAVISILVTGFTAGVFWLFVFGDNPWPPIVEKLFPILLALVFLTLWLGLVSAGFLVGKRLEQNPVLNRKHMLASAGVTLLLILIIVLQQVSVGNLGPKSAAVQCSTFCSQKGFSASGLNPQNSSANSCSCLDPLGNEVIKIPLDQINSAH